MARVIHSNYKNASIDDFHLDFSSIWKRDINERSVFDLWLHVVDHASRIANAVKQQNPPSIIDDIADTTVWLLSFISFCDNFYKTDKIKVFNISNPSDIIWQKYPAICPSCLDNIIVEKLDLISSKNVLFDFNQKKHMLEFLDEKNNEFSLLFRPCDCINRISNDIRKKEIITTLRSELDDIRFKYAEILKKKGKNLLKVSDIENMFSKIYSNYYHVLTLESIVFNLLGDIGESSQAIVNLYTYDESREPFSLDLLKRRRLRLSDEIADIFAWLYATSIKIRLTYGKIAQSYYTTITKSQLIQFDINKLSFVDIIWSKYGKTSDGANWDKLKCPGCQSEPCSCPRDLKIDWSESNSVIFEKKKEIKSEIIKSMKEKDLIFISYSHKDQKWLDEVKTMLKPLERDKKISTWDDTRILPGKRWREEIDSALSRAKIALLLVSPNFLASDFINTNELPPLLTAAKSNGTSIIWIPISASMYKSTEIANYQAATSPDEPLDSLNKAQRNKILVQICEFLKEISNS